MKKISIIIPVYNSALSLDGLNREIDTYFDHKAYVIEKIFVNDFSQDLSYSVLEEIKAKDSRIKCTYIKRTKVVHLKKNAGQQNAIFCGLHYATGDIILTMDDDLQHDIAYIDSMLALLDQGYDLIYGVHAVEENDLRSLGSKMTGRFFKKNYPALSGKRVSSFRVFKKSLLKEVLACPYGFIYLSALLLKQEPNVANVEIGKRPRVYGQSGYTLKKLIALYMKLTFYYGPFVPEILKARRLAYEEIDDARCGQLPAKCH